MNETEQINNCLELIRALFKQIRNNNLDNIVTFAIVIRESISESKKTG